MRVFEQILSVFTRRRLTFDIDLIPLTFRNLPPRKIVNWVLTEGSVIIKPVKPFGLPTILQIEPTNRCNLKCKACPVATGLGRPGGYMDFGLYRTIIDQLKDHVLVLMFWDWGEPFLHPQAPQMIRYAQQRGVQVVSSTNGHLFEDRHLAEEVVASGLSVLVFSIDGLTRESYRRFRDGGSLDRVTTGVRNVVSARKKLGASTPVVNVRFIVTRHNENEIEAAPDFARDLGADVLTLRKFHFVPESGDADSGDGQRRGMEMAPVDARYQLPFLGSAGRPIRVRHNPCKNLWNCPTIHWDGTVCSCFMDSGQQRALGSLEEQRFSEIWRGEKYAHLRRSFKNSWQRVPICNECACGFLGGNVGREANQRAVFFR
jgi:radical SAM protein with 4Fe4S-binding SPASM domain